MSNDQIKEDISTFVDGEVHENRQAEILKSINADKYLQEKLQRYQLISDALKGQLPSVMAKDMNERIKEAVAKEPVISEDSPSVSAASASPLKRWVILLFISVVVCFLVAPKVWDYYTSFTKKGDAFSTTHSRSGDNKHATGGRPIRNEGRMI